MARGDPTIAPFRALLYSQEKIPDLSRAIAPPYDVISPPEQEALYERHPLNVVRLILAKETPHDTARDNRYTRAARDFRSWVRQGILVRDKAPSLYLYEQEFSFRSERLRRRGVIALRRLEPLGRGVRPHEKTMSGPKEDRLRLMKAVGAQLSPIFMIYRDSRGAGSLLEPFYGRPPLMDLSDSCGVRHRLWRVTEAGVLEEVAHRMAQDPHFIADGHHRYETMLSYREWLRKKGRGCDFVMTYFNGMEDPGLKILPTHRLFPLWSGDEEALIARLRKGCGVQGYPLGERKGFLEDLAREEGRRRVFGLVLPRGLHLVTEEDGSKKTELDVLFAEKMLPRPEKVLYLKEADEVLRLVGENHQGLGVLLNPPSVEEVVRVIEKEELLPPKTTYFYPKLASGLVFYKI